MSVLISLQILSETFLILRKIQRGIIINVHRSSCDDPGIFVIFSCNLNRQLFKKFSNINAMKICPVGAKLFHAHGWTDMTKLAVAIWNFVYMPKNPQSGQAVTQLRLEPSTSPHKNYKRHNKQWISLCKIQHWIFWRKHALFSIKYNWINFSLPRIMKNGMQWIWQIYGYTLRSSSCFWQDHRFKCNCGYCQLSYTKSLSQSIRYSEQRFLMGPLQ